jgi:hypothetical protein
MNYFIQRSGQEYGPYTLADLQRYVKSGEISPADMCRSEGMTGLLPVSQIVGNIPAPVQQPLQTVYGGAGSTPSIDISSLPKPPDLHWGIVFLLSVVTCSLFSYIWLLVQAAFVKKIDASSRAMTWLIVCIACYWALPIITAATGISGHNSAIDGLTAIGQLAGLGFYIAGIFSMKGSLEDYYNSREPIGLKLSGVMVFFFAPFYFQYHFNQTSQRHKSMGVVGA